MKTALLPLAVSALLAIPALAQPGPGVAPAPQEKPAATAPQGAPGPGFAPDAHAPSTLPGPGRPGPPSRR